MKKVIKIILLVIWGLFTIGSFLYGAIQYYEIERQRNFTKEIWDYKRELEVELLDEYYRNFNLICEDSCLNINIDSIFENSIFLKDFEKSLKKVNKEIK